MTYKEREAKSLINGIKIAISVMNILHGSLI